MERDEDDDNESFDDEEVENSKMPELMDFLKQKPSVVRLKDKLMQTEKKVKKN
jgi:hypothetical protein